MFFSVLGLLEGANNKTKHLPPPQQKALILQEARAQYQLHSAVNPLFRAKGWRKGLALQQGTSPRAHEPQRSKAGNDTHVASLAAGAENAIFDMAPGTWQYSQQERHELHANARLDQSGSRLLTAECDKTVKIYREEILTALPPPLCFALLRSACASWSWFWLLEDPNATPETHPLNWKARMTHPQIPCFLQNFRYLKFRRMG